MQLNMNMISYVYAYVWDSQVMDSESFQKYGNYVHIKGKESILSENEQASLNKIKPNQHLQREHTFRIVRHNLIVFHKQMPGFDRMAEAAIKLAERSCPAGKVRGFPFL